jgi:hypothetical protein
VRLTVVRAESLPKAERMGGIHAFVQLRFDVERAGGKRVVAAGGRPERPPPTRTTVKKGTYGPEWREDFTLSLDDQVRGTVGVYGEGCLWVGDWEWRSRRLKAGQVAAIGKESLC